MSQANALYLQGEMLVKFQYHQQKILIVRDLRKMILLYILLILKLQHKKSLYINIKNL